MTVDRRALRFDVLSDKAAHVNIVHVLFPPWSCLSVDWLTFVSQWISCKFLFVCNTWFVPVIWTVVDAWWAQVFTDSYHWPDFHIFCIAQTFLRMRLLAFVSISITLTLLGWYFDNRDKTVFVSLALLFTYQQHRNGAINFMLDHRIFTTLNMW